MRKKKSSIFLEKTNNTPLRFLRNTFLKSKDKGFLNRRNTNKFLGVTWDDKIPHGSGVPIWNGSVMPPTSVYRSTLLCGNTAARLPCRVVIGRTQNSDFKTSKTVRTFFFQNKFPYQLRSFAPLPLLPRFMLPVLCCATGINVGRNIVRRSRPSRTDDNNACTSRGQTTRRRCLRSIQLGRRAVTDGDKARARYNVRAATKPTKICPLPRFDIPWYYYRYYDTHKRGSTIFFFFLMFVRIALLLKKNI